MSHRELHSVYSDAKHNKQFLDRLFAENPIPCLVTNADGTLVYINSSFRKLIEIDSRLISVALGHYNIFNDKNILSADGVAEALATVYQQAQAQMLDITYPLAAVSNHPDHVEKSLYFRASLLPVRDKFGKLELVLIQLQDMSHEKKALHAVLKQQRKLQEIEANYRAFVANSSEAIWCYDIVPSISLDADVATQAALIEDRAQLSQGNRVFIKMLGANSLQDIIGNGLAKSGSSDYIFDLQYFVENNYHMVDRDLVREDPKGRPHYFQISCVGIIENNYLTRIWGTTKDVTAGVRYRKKLEHISLHDALTDLPNRDYIYQEIGKFYRHTEHEKITRSETAVETHSELAALLFIDLDRFKEINDTLGHQVGDRLLQLIGPRITSEMGELNGTIARMGGDEFAIFLPSIRHQQQAIVFAHCILDALRLEFDLDGLCLEISSSIGIAFAPVQATDVNTLMRYADVAMYYAKEQLAGIAVYQADIDPHSPKRLAMMSELRKAIREDQLCLHYQPKVNLPLKKFYGFEALVRWRHPELGLVQPNEFIHIAEMTSLIHELTSWVLEKSIAQCCLWRREGLDLSIAVNLSARNLHDENMPKQVRNLLNKYSLPPHALELEITESSIMSDPNRAMRVLTQLHELGVQLSIDDFGTGYSSLAYLKKLPVQTLKIDISFIRNMLNDHQDQLIVQSTIQLAHSLNLKVIAEGVEDAPLVQRLTMMGCDEAQGYHIGRPMQIEQVTQWIVESFWAKNA